MNKLVVIIGLMMWFGLSTFFLIIGTFQFSLIIGFFGLIVTLVGFIMKDTQKELPPPPTSHQNPQMYNFQQRPAQNTSNINPPSQAQNSSNGEDVITQIEKWGKLKEKGLITEEEFQKKKNELL